MPDDDFAAKRSKGGKATARKYHRPDSSETPSIKSEWKADGGPLRNDKTNLGKKAYCYVHRVEHSWAECPANPANEQEAK
jgi:hypothetical protein